ncbi:MAG TPA: tRNA uridine-5-carboxymethylaminomethyl(34) synthesis GTPase MnmE [Candidatus Baltobacteraceae bacterium]|nr:tRNA uridine-5-carboxymethylaminomethyl(34) synthesis GTPase MnmE [Candidatus Baltobacteraceae bacterium]
MTDNDTIAAIATPPGKGAIAIVRVSGPQARSLASRLFVCKGDIAPRVATYGTVVDEQGAAIDKGLAIVSIAPHSYTGEDTVEFHVHGSPVVAREVVRALIACGARYASAGEFTRRAFLNGKLDLHAAAAVADLIDAQTRSAARAALANLGGGLANEVRAIRARLATILEELAGAVDFPDEVPEPDRGALRGELDAIVSELQRLQREGEAGRLVREGVPVAIVGPPNAGKSSLLNALLGEERALVSEIAGTTRDTIEESITVRGVQMRLIDTAGIREHADRLEAAGIERTQRALASARVALVVIDGSVALGSEARSLLEQTADRARVVFANKADLGTAGAAQLDGVAHIRGSVGERAALDRIREALAQAVWGAQMPDLERPHLASLTELDAVAQALDALAHAQETLRSRDPLDLIVGELQRAFAALGHLTGDAANEEMLTGLFARFCIGK